MRFPERMNWLASFKKTNVDPTETYSVRIFRLASAGVDEIRKLFEDRTINQPRYGLSRVEWFAVFNEFQNLYFHLTEREAFNHLGNRGSHELMRGLLKWSIDLSVNTLCDGLPRE